MGRREKKLEKKKAKRTEKKRELTRVESMGIVGHMRRAAHCPVLHCSLHGDDDETQGITQLLFSRRLPDGKVALVVFLIDLWCLGVKNLTVKVAAAQQYRDFHDRLQNNMPGSPLDPQSARRFVEDAIAFALKYGFPPHRDTPKALPIFGDIEASAAARTFEFGKRGMPYYFAGPHDSIARQRQIVETLRRTAGEGNFHYTMSAFDPTALSLSEDDFLDSLEYDDSDLDLQSDDEDEHDNALKPDSDHDRPLALSSSPDSVPPSPAPENSER